MFGMIVTGSAPLSKLGDAGWDGSQGWPTPAGMVAQRSVIPAGAGAKVVAKPANMKVPGPLGKSSSNTERFPVESGGTVSGLIATQQLDPFCASKTSRTVCTAFGSCADTPPPGCCHMVCTPAPPVPTDAAELPPLPPQAESSSRHVDATVAPINLCCPLNFMVRHRHNTLAIH